MSRQACPIFTLPLKATTANSSGHFVTPLGATPAAGGNTAGVTRFDAAIGDVMSVDVMGTAMVISGGAFAAGALLDTDANGCAVAHSTGVGVARAIQASAASGAIVEVLLLPN